MSEELKCPHCSQKDKEIGGLKVELDNLRHFCDSLFDMAKRNNGVLYFEQDNGTWKIETDKEQTVFDHITQSVETLADSVVMPIIVEYSGDVLWVSPLLQKDASKRAIFFDSKEEAIAATIEELRKVWKK